MPVTTFAFGSKKETIMYTFLRAAVLPNTVTPQWSVVDLSAVAVSEIYASYREVVLGLKPSDGTDEIFVDMASLKAEYAMYNATLATLLQSLGDLVLETIPKFPTEQLKYVKYSDIYQIGYKATLCRRGFIDPYDYPVDEMPDLKLTRPNHSTDLSLIHTHCLVSVNGFYHQTDTDGTDAFVVDGGKSALRGGTNHIGLLGFLDIGKVTKQALSVDLIHPKSEAGVMKNGIEFSVENDLTGKSVFLVLGGYLVFPQADLFYSVGDKTFQLNIDRLPYLERILESKNWLDLSGLGLTVSEINPETINVAEVWSDAVLKKYMTLSQSFLVIVDSTNLFTNRLHLRQNNFPGFFTSLNKPTYPLVAGFGRCAEYWRKYEDKLWVATAMDTFRRNYVFNRQQHKTFNNVTGQLAPDTPYHHSLSYLLEIGARKEQ